jgi:hypothetical protein
VGSSTGASAGRGEATEIDSRGSSSLPEEASASGAGAAGVAGGTVVFTAAGERFTIKLPRFAGSALREARAAAARAAAESGEAREAPAAERGAGVDAGGGSCGGDSSSSSLSSTAAAATEEDGVPPADNTADKVPAGCSNSPSSGGGADDDGATEDMRDGAREPISQAQLTCQRGEGSSVDAGSGCCRRGGGRSEEIRPAAATHAARARTREPFRHNQDVPYFIVRRRIFEVLVSANFLLEHFQPVRRCQDWNYLMEIDRAKMETMHNSMCNAHGT